jgi:hypothetical protein
MRYLRQTISASALALLFTLGIGGAAQAACYGSGQELSAQVVSQFVNDPGRLLNQFPDGGPQMIPLIRDLVASDPGSLPLILSLNAKANADQIQAIGTGLGQAALVCSRTAQPFASEILRMTMTADNQPLSQAFSAVMGDLFLSSPGPDGGAGGGGGPTMSSGGTGGAVAGGGGGTVKLPTTPPKGSPDAPLFGPSPPGTPGSLGNLFTQATPGGPNAPSKSVSPSRP